MDNIVQAILSSAVFPVMGLAAMLTILLIPLVLRLAGLSGKQIVDTIALTLQFFRGLVQSFRDENKNGSG